MLSHADEIGAPNLMCIATIRVFTLLAGHSAKYL